MIRCVAPSPAMDVTYLLPSLLPGEMNRPTAMLRRAGGKAFNVARVVRALGLESVVVGPIGGLTGDAIERAAREEGVPFLSVYAEHESRTCVSIFTEDGPESTEINQRVEPIGDTWEKLIQTLAEHRSPTTAISGSLPPDATADGLTKLVSAARPGVVAVDIHGPAASTWLSTGPDVDIVKVNEREACELLGHATPENQTEAVALARSLQAFCGGRLVIVTRGEEGSIACTENEVGVVAGTETGPYPVGSGDAFLAALLAHLPSSPWSLADVTLQESLRLAAAAAGVNAHHLGAGSVERAAVVAVRATVRFTPLIR